MTGLWIAAAALTVVVVALLVAPLVFRRTLRVPPRAAFDLAVYRDQLGEIDRDVERGLLSAEQAEASRVEIKRRILAAADGAGASTRPPPRRVPILAAMIAVAVPAGAVALYLGLGAPQHPDHPFAARGDAPSEVAAGEHARELEAALARVEDQLRDSPLDADGWLRLGRIRLALERPSEAADAFRRARALDPGRPEVAARLGEALVAAAGGRVTEEARAAFADALAGNPLSAEARYYLALDRAQQGDSRGAAQGWVDLVALSPRDSPWLDTVRDQIYRAAEALGVDPQAITPTPEALLLAERLRLPGPSAADMAAAAALPAEERDAMIRAMVDRLAARLEQAPEDREGWLRLARAYEVLGETEKARSALRRAEALP